MKPPHPRSALPLLSEERVWGEEHQHMLREVSQDQLITVTETE